MNSKCSKCNKNAVRCKCDEVFVDNYIENMLKYKVVPRETIPLNKIRFEISEEQLTLFKENGSVIYSEGEEYYKFPFWIKKNIDGKYTFHTDDEVKKIFN